MGLTIHYKFESNTRLSSKQVQKIVEDMHDYALVLKERGLLQDVGEVQYVSKEDIETIRNSPRTVTYQHPLQWALIQSSKYIRKRALVGKDYRGRNEYKDIHAEIYPEEGWLFTTNPGEGCEQANFGLMRYPTEVEIPNQYYASEPKVKIKTDRKGWSWGSFCKTQYASNYGELNFVKCHIAVCSMLEHIYLNDKLNLEVSDESDFWDERNITNLISEVGEWNQMIATFVGALVDANQISDFKEMSVVSPIFDNPQFETLETEGIKNKVIPNIDQITHLISEMLQIHK